MNQLHVVFVDGRLDAVAGYLTVIKPNRIPLPMMDNPKALLMEPGSAASHRGITLCSEYGIPIYWVARGATRIISYDAANLLDIRKLPDQVQMANQPDHARAAAYYMLKKRFGIRTHPGHAISVIRGKEGAAVKKAYQALADQYNVEWVARRYDQPWDESSPINRSISVATSCLYALAEIAITLTGYSPHLGAIHKSKRRAFVFDIADMEKLNSVIPIAFRAVATGSNKPEWITRAWCARYFRETSLLNKLINHTESVVNASKAPSQSAPCRGRRSLPKGMAASRRRAKRL